MNGKTQAVVLALALALALALVPGAGGGMALASDVASRDGAVRVVEMAADGSAVVEVASHRDGWACRGTYAAPETNGATVRFALDCDDAMRGDAMMSVDRETGRAALIFKRDNGDRGSAAFSLR